MFIPNNNFKLFDKIYGNNEIVCPNTSYSSDMKWMKDDKKLKRISINGRKSAIKLFGKNNIKRQWEVYLDTL